MRTKAIFVAAQLLFGAAFFCAGADAASAGSVERLQACPLIAVDIASECISTHRLDTFAYSELIDMDTRVLVFGETHFADAHRNELIGALPTLKGLGFTHLALEAMPTSRQTLVADYKAGRASAGELASEIAAIWGHNPLSYVRLIDAAMALDIEVVFLDSDRERIDLAATNWRELEREARSRREKHWMDTLSLLTQSNETSRVIMLVGSGHNAANAVTPPVSAQLSARSIKNTSIALEGGEAFIDSVLTMSARNAKIAGMRFLVKVESRAPNAEGDYHLHLRQAKSNKARAD